MFDGVHAYALARGKQFLIGESGVSEDKVADGVNEKALALAAFAPVLSSYGTSGPGSLAAMLYTIDGGSIPASSPDALAAFGLMAQDPFFAAS